MNKSAEIRNQFIDFFREKEHTVIPSAPVLPADDPTLLFTNAGMNQFKDVFLEQGSRPYSRAVNSQKCIRVSGKHNDLEEVGPSPSHHTFFEMLGNWSFGDYYKSEAIRWAWELITEVWRIDIDRLYATVFKGNDEVQPDDEARDAWLQTGISPDRITRHGRKDNFWEMGETGPCGPCSEIHYDLGAEFCLKKAVKGHKCEVNGDCGRIVELWNLVFIQYKRDGKGKLNSLPRKHVDTGAGLERFLRVLEGVGSNYETSLFKPLLTELVNISRVDYSSGDSGIPHRVAVDHVRMLAFSLADGILPSNEGRGYVLRRILRRAARYGREIGLETPFLYKLVDPLVDVMGTAYPEIKERYKHITEVIRAEEESFARTLGRGLELFGGVVEKLEKEKKTVISGDDAFKLYDTHGFPLDLTELMARERNLKVDEERFAELLREQKETSKVKNRLLTLELDSFASGYQSKFKENEPDPLPSGILTSGYTGSYYSIILEETPFYPVSGGQVSDEGIIEWGTGSLDVEEVTKKGDVIIHSGSLHGDEPAEEVIANAEIDHNRRLQIRYNHTATHLLHTALRKHVGMHANQAGSLVAPDRLRFDFTHFEKLTPELIEEIELNVNRAIREDYPVRWYVKPFQEALDSGITALFGEKYGEQVRVIHIGYDEHPYSRELCGGTHVERTGQLGLFRIVSEGAVSAGVRRIEAVTGETAVRLALSEKHSLEDIADLLGSHGSDPVEKLSKTLEEKHSLEKEFELLLESWAKGIADELLSEAVIELPPRSPGGNKRGDIAVISRLFDNLEVDRMKLIGDKIRELDSHAVALLASPVSKGAGQLCCVVGDAVIKDGKLKAGDLVSEAAKLAGGGGGGRPHMATAGTKYPDRLPLAVDGFMEIVKKALGKN